MSDELRCPGSAQLTKNGKACEIKLDVPLYCGLTADSVPGWPRCYNDSGRALTIPPAPAGASAAESSPAKKKLQPNCSDITNAQYDNLINSINEIHGYEQKLFKDLEAVENGGKAEMNAMEIKGRIADLSKLRTQLYTDLNNVLTSTHCKLSESRENLADQIAMVEIVKKELDNAEEAIKEMKIIRDNRQRMVQITKYEKDRFASHSSIFRTIALCSLGVLVSVFLTTKGFDTVGKVGIVVFFALAFILTMRAVWLNWWRNNMDWYRFDSIDDQMDANQETVVQHDLRALDKLYDDTSAEIGSVENRVEKRASQAYHNLNRVMNRASNAARGDMSSLTSGK